MNKDIITLNLNFKIKIDKKQILKELIENLRNHNIIDKNNYLKPEYFKNNFMSLFRETIKEQIKEILINELELYKLKNVFIEEGWHRKYLTQKAKKILDEYIDNEVEKYVREYLKRNFKNLITNEIEEFLETYIIPLLNKFVSNLVIVNTEKLQEEIDSMQRDYESIINSFVPPPEWK